MGWPLDLDALIAYIQNLPQPFTAAIKGRIMALNGVEVRIVNASTDETSPNPQKGLSAMEVELP